jgi:hypothetical protein
MADPQQGKPDTFPALPDGTAESDSTPASCESAGDAADKHLPVVDAPKLDASDAALPPAVEAFIEMSRATAGEDTGARSSVAAGAAALRPSRSTLLAVAFALAAAMGALAGSLSASGLAQFWQPAPAKSATADTGGVLQAMKVELAAMKASLDVATRSAGNQVAKITDRLERVERSGSEPATKLAHIAESVDRLEKKNAAMAAAMEATGAIGASETARTEPKIVDRIVEGWIVQDVRRGRALVESHYGGMFVVGTGGSLPGLGRVEAIKRQDGQWVVVTAHGTITSTP